MSEDSAKSGIAVGSEEILDVGVDSSNAESIYQSSGNSKLTLYLLSIGLTDNARFPNIHGIRSNQNNEIIQCATRVKMNPLPRPINWKTDVLMDWLREHPRTSDKDTSFIYGEVNRIKELVKKSITECDEYDAKVSGGHWRDKLPHLRMIHAIIEDDIKGKYIHHNETLPIQQCSKGIITIFRGLLTSGSGGNDATRT